MKSAAEARPAAALPRRNAAITAYLAAPSASGGRLLEASHEVERAPRGEDIGEPERFGLVRGKPLGGEQQPECDRTPDRINQSLGAVPAGNKAEPSR